MIGLLLVLSAPFDPHRPIDVILHFEIIGVAAAAAIYIKVPPMRTDARDTIECT